MAQITATKQNTENFPNPSNTIISIETKNQLLTQAEDIAKFMENAGVDEIATKTLRISGEILGESGGVAIDLVFKKSSETYWQAFCTSAGGSAAGGIASAGIVLGLGALGLTVAPLGALIIAGTAGWLLNDYVFDPLWDKYVDKSADFDTQIDQQTGKTNVTITTTDNNPSAATELASPFMLQGHIEENETVGQVEVKVNQGGTTTQTYTFKPDNSASVTSTSQLTNTEAVKIVEATLLSQNNINQISINDTVNHYTASKSGNDIDINLNSGNATDFVSRWFSDGSTSVDETGTLNIDINATDIHYTIEQNGANNQTHISTNNTNMNQLGTIMQEASADGTNVTIESNGKTITGLQQNNQLVITSSDLTQAQKEAVQVGFLGSIANSIIKITANIFGTLLDPLRGLLNVSNSVFSQIGNFFRNIWDAIGAFYEGGTLVYDESLSIADKTGRLFSNNTALSKTEFLAMDTNNDGLINSLDTKYTTLKLWKDTNENGILDSGEIKTLSEAGIASIKVADADLKKVA